LVLLFANSAYANIEEIINRLQPYFPNISADQINESQLDGFYEVIITEPRIEVMYISSDARYVFQGNVTDLVTMSNLSAIRINATRKRILDNIDETTRLSLKQGMNSILFMFLQMSIALFAQNCMPIWQK
jgi:thiol:disulfide interchange protein DsbC